MLFFFFNKSWSWRLNLRHHVWLKDKYFLQHRIQKWWSSVVLRPLRVWTPRAGSRVWSQCLISFSISPNVATSRLRSACLRWCKCFTQSLTWVLHLVFLSESMLLFTLSALGCVCEVCWRQVWVWLHSYRLLRRKLHRPWVLLPSRDKLSYPLVLLHF